MKINDSKFLWEKYHNAPIVGIVRGLPKSTIYRIAESYGNSGLSTLEITMNTHGAADIIKNLRNDFPNLNIGAGTVCTIEEYDRVVEAGAQFIVTPIVAEAVIMKSIASGIPIFPGAFTVTEIYKAWSLGVSAVKIFPATQLGPQYIKDILGPLDQVKLLPTGGVSKDNIESFFEAGAYGVGMGSSLLDKDLIAKKDFKGLEAHFLQIKNKIIQYTR